jgi:hypothetical protein
MSVKKSSVKLRTHLQSRQARLVGVAGMVLASFVTGTAILGTGPAPTAHAAEIQGAAEPATTGGPAMFRRMTEAQYRRSIEDIFGPGIKVPGRFDPPLREAGLLAIGDGKVAVSPSGIEQYELRAREISAQVLAESRRKTLLSCSPKSANAFDKPCATAFLGKYGRLLFRRPLTDSELTTTVTLAGVATQKTGNFYKGLEIGLARLLSSPDFIFRVERSERDPARSGALRLDAYSLAARISFLLWNAPPDSELLDAAASGALHQPQELDGQVDRLISSPRFEQGVRAFFSDMFGYEQFDGLSKDQAIYPKYNTQLAKDAQEQALRTIIDLLVTNKGDYRDLFSTEKTFINRNLGSLYKVQLDDAGLDGWVPYSFAPDDPRAGILTFAAFLMLDPTHEGRSSPTIRGKSVRELFLCQPVPVPPPNVDFSAVQNTADQVHKTARDRLSVHQQNPVCAGCHSIMDPIGLSMENYDAVGAFRTKENGAPIDASGTFEGKSYKDVIALEQLLHDSQTAPNCVAERAYEYGVGRALTPSEEKWLEFASQSFAADKYQFAALLRRIATSKAFQAVSADKIASSK